MACKARRGAYDRAGAEDAADKKSLEKPDNRIVDRLRVGLQRVLDGMQLALPAVTQQPEKAALLGGRGVLVEGYSSGMPKEEAFGTERFAWSKTICFLDKPPAGWYT